MTEHDNTLNQDTVIPTVLPGVAFRVIAGAEQVHLVLASGQSIAAFLPADARRLAALIIGAAFSMDEPGTVADMAALIELVRAQDAQAALLHAWEPGGATN
jgi:hypothetical protein